MLKRFLSRAKPSPVPQELYGRVVAQARQPLFFAAMGVPDTVPGRFDMVCLHIFLLTRRLAADADPLARPLSQDLFDVFTRELDASLRELGVGDTSVSKRMKRMLASYYALITELDPPLAGSNWGELGSRAAARFAAHNPLAKAFFAHYIRHAASALSALPLHDLARGRLDWPALEPSLPQGKNE